MLVLFFDNWVASVSKLHHFVVHEKKKILPMKTVMHGLGQKGIKTIWSCPVKFLDCYFGWLKLDLAKTYLKNLEAWADEKIW